MERVGRRGAVVLGFGLFVFSGQALAQDDLNAGKTPAQLFAANCTACHKSPKGLITRSIGLTGFLRQHYTTSSAQAAALAAYVSEAGPDPRAARTEPAASAPAGRAAPRQAGRPVDPRLQNAEQPAPTSASAPPATERPPTPPVVRDSRLPVSVSTDPDPFVISTDPIVLPPEPERPAPLRVPRPAASSAPPAATPAPAEAAVAPATAAVPPVVEVPAAEVPAPTEPAAAAPAAAPAGPGFSAPLP